MNTRKRPDLRRRSKSTGVGPWLLGGVGALLLVGIVVFGAYSSLTNRALDPENNCPMDHYDSVTAVLIDLTDPVNPVQSAALKNALERIKNSIPKYGRLEIYPLLPTKSSAISPIFAACNPGSGKDVSSFVTGNAELSDRIWKERFGQKIDAIITKIQQVPQEDNSPIFEGIQSVSVTAFDPPLAVSSSHKTLVIVSDMLHYTPELSMYAGAPEFSKFGATQYFVRNKTDLHGADVDVYLIVRETRKNAQQPPLYQFWVDYFEANQGSLRDWVLLQ
jgi:hypothetical protein